MKENVLEKSHFVPTSSPSIPVEVIVWKHANITLSLSLSLYPHLWSPKWLLTSSNATTM
jgi:hypothetical protein